MGFAETKPTVKSSYFRQTTRQIETNFGVTCYFLCTLKLSCVESYFQA